MKSVNGLTPYPELEGHVFEIIRLNKVGENWEVRFAVDGIPYPVFCEPHCNVARLKDDEFMDYMKSQALTMVQAVEQGVVA